MTATSNKVVWYEGMTLDPQHFQQWDRYHQERLDARVEALSRLHWGLTSLSIDEERLGNGEFALNACSGVLPDGLVLEMPGASPLPAPRPVGEAMDSTQTQVDVFLAVPSTPIDRSIVERPVRQDVPGNGTPEQNSHTRYTSTVESIRDETTGADAQSIEVARTNAQIRFGTESLDGFTTLPIARVARSGGTFVLDSGFIPCVLHAGVSSRLLQVCRRIVELLVTKSRALMDRQREAMNQREFSPSDAVRLNMLQLVNLHIPQLRHHLEGGPDHPADVFRTLASLAGGLSAVHPDLPAPQDLPTYDHRSPSRPFGALFDAISNALQDTHTSDSFTSIPLERQRENLFVASVMPSQLESAQLLLAARSQARAEDELVERLPHMLRIASPEHIDQVIGQAISALRIEPTRRLPPGMPIDERASYFRLLKTGPFWDRIQEAEALAIFVPSEYSDVSLSLTATS